MTNDEYTPSNPGMNVKLLAAAVGVSLAACDSCGHGTKDSAQLCEEIEARATSNGWHKWTDTEPDKSRRILHWYEDYSCVLRWVSRQNAWVDPNDDYEMTSRDGCVWCYLP